jgi:hypothetical protein
MKKQYGGFTRRGPDNLTEELAVVLSLKASYEFKALFEIIHQNLRARNAATGGEEMLRLRTYEKLQNLVSQGIVKKTAGKYRGVTSAITNLSEQLKTLRSETTAKRPAATPAPAAAAA